MLIVGGNPGEDGLQRIVDRRKHRAVGLNPRLGKFCSISNHKILYVWASDLYVRFCSFLFFSISPIPCRMQVEIGLSSKASNMQSYPKDYVDWFDQDVVKWNDERLSIVWPIDNPILNWRDK